MRVFFYLYNIRNRFSRRYTYKVFGSKSRRAAAFPDRSRLSNTIAYPNRYPAMKRTFALLLAATLLLGSSAASLSQNRRPVSPPPPVGQQNRPSYPEQSRPDDQRHPENRPQRPSKHDDRHRAQYVVDAWHVYYRGRKVAEASASSFRNLGDGYGCDAWSVFYKGVKMQHAAVLSFENLGDGYARDTWTVFYDGERLADAAVSSFRVPATPGTTTTAAAKWPNERSATDKSSSAPGVTSATAAVSVVVDSAIRCPAKSRGLWGDRVGFFLFGLICPRPAGLRGRFKRSLQILETPLLMGRRLRSRTIEYCVAVSCIFQSAGKTVF